MTEYVGPDAPVRAGERSSPHGCGASLRRADESVRPYVASGDPGTQVFSLAEGLYRSSSARTVPSSMSARMRKPSFWQMARIS
jgi:hypothetical protein